MNVRAIVFGLIIATASTTVALAQQPPGSYQQSCSNIRFDGEQLSAICADARGRRVPTSLMVGRCGGGISNDNGQLTCGAGSRRDYDRGEGRRYRDDDDEFDRPRPRRGYGGDDDGFRGQQRRDDGFRGAGSQVPGGSWHGSCKNAQMQGPILTALCANSRGQFQQTNADTRSCRSFTNRNGNLSCE